MINVLPIYKIFSIHVILVIVAMSCNTHREIKALYGFSKELEPFKGKDAEEIAYILSSWGINAVFGGYKDKQMLEALRKYGIKTYVSVRIFHNGRFWHKYPQSRPIDVHGNPIEKEEWYTPLTPSNHEVRMERLAEIEKLVSSYDVDGVWLDFTYWPCLWERPKPKLYQTSFDSVSIKKFEKETGVAIPLKFITITEKAKWILNNHKNKWIRWKCEQITSFVREAKEIVKERGKLLGLFVVPFLPEDYENAIEEIIGQDYKALSRYVDIFSPMVYHLMCDKEVVWIKKVIEYIYNTTNRSVLPIVQGCSEPKELSEEEFKQAIWLSLSAEGSKGVIIFSLKHVVTENKIDAMREALAWTKAIK